jgi:hypothetical protein
MRQSGGLRRIRTENLPPKRKKPAMTAEERSKVTKELTAVHDRQTS